MQNSKQKNEHIQTRNVLLEFNKNLNIKTCQTWFRNYKGEIVRVPHYSNIVGYITKTPTLKANGFKVVYAKIWGDLLGWKNQDLVVYVMSKHHINKRSEVIYHVTIEKNSKGKLNAKDIQLFYK